MDSVPGGVIFSTDCPKCITYIEDTEQGLSSVCVFRLFLAQEHFSPSTDMNFFIHFHPKSTFIEL